MAVDKHDNVLIYHLCTVSLCILIYTGHWLVRAC